MANVSIKLKGDDGKIRTYRKTSVKARWLRKALEHQAEVEKLEAKNDSLGILDARVQFAVDFFDDKELTADAIWDGLENYELIPALLKVFNQIVGMDGDDNKPGKQ